MAEEGASTLGAVWWCWRLAEHPGEGNHSSLQQVGSKGLEPGPGLLFLTAPSRFLMKATLRMA